MLVRGSRYSGTKQVRKKIIYRGLVIDLLFETARIAHWAFRQLSILGYRGLNLQFATPLRVLTDKHKMVQSAIPCANVMFSAI